MSRAVVTQRQRRLEAIRNYNRERADLVKAAEEDAKEPGEVEHFVEQIRSEALKDLIADARRRSEASKTLAERAAADSDLKRFERFAKARSWGTAPPDEAVVGQLEAAVREHLEAGLESDDERTRELAGAALERLSDGSVGELVKVAAARFAGPFLGRARRVAGLIADVRALEDVYREAQPAAGEVAKWPSTDYRPPTPDEKAAAANRAASIRLSPTAGRSR